MTKASKTGMSGYTQRYSLRFERSPQCTVIRHHDAETRLVPYEQGDSLQQITMPFLPSEMSDRTNDACPGRKEVRSCLNCGKPTQINTTVDRLHLLGWHATGDEDVPYGVR